MIDYNSITPEELAELHRKKMEEVQSMMNKIVSNPSEVTVDDIKKTIQYANEDVTDQ
jgi:hypothetical protein